MATGRARVGLPVGWILLLLPALADGKLTAEQKCVVKKLAAAGRQAAAKIGCVRAAVGKSGAVDPLCIAKAESKLLKAFQRAERKPGCEATGAAAVVGDAIDACVAGVESSVAPTGSNPSTTHVATTTLVASTTSTLLPNPSYLGTISIEEVSIPSYGQGLDVDVRFVGTNGAPTPVFDELPDSDEGCTVWELTPAQAADVGLDEGTITVTGGTPAIAPCIYAGSPGYLCIRHNGIGGVVAAGPAPGTATFTASLILPSGSFTANELGHYLRISGAVAAGNNGSFPILAVANANTLVFGNPAFVAESFGTSTGWFTLSGSGPIPQAPDPGFLADGDSLMVTLTPGGDNQFAAFAPVVNAGDDFTLDAASTPTLSGIPLDGTAFSLGCDAAGNQCGVASRTRLVITTTDAPLAGLGPFALPPPVTKSTVIRCESTTGTTVTVPAAASAFLMASGATRVEARYARINRADGSAAGASHVVEVGHAIAGYTTP